jgi:hypothetical protein
MSENQPFATRFAKVPLGLLGAIVLVWAIEGQIVRREPVAFTTVWAADWRQTAKLATQKAVDTPILCFGDSIAKFGLDPAELQSSTGLKAYNLALNVGYPASSYFLLKRVVHSGIRPKVVLLEFTSHILSEPPQSSARQWPEMINAGEWLDLVLTTRDPVFAATLACQSLFPSVRTRFEIREATLAFLRGEWPSHTYMLPILKKNWCEHDGAQIAVVGKEKNQQRNPAFATEALVRPDWQPNPIGDQYVRRFLNLATGSGARVIVVVPPMSPEIQAKRLATGVETAYHAYLGRLMADFPSLQVLDGSGAATSADLHCDPIHLASDGSTLFSRQVGDLIRTSRIKEGSADRLVRLAPLGAETATAEIAAKTASGQASTGGSKR